eukprot:COSAG05_NODE_383_length_10498_cov_2.642273_1_plen_59_part_10
MGASLSATCRGLTIDQQSAAALGSLSSSYGFVGVFAREVRAIVEGCEGGGGCVEEEEAT